MSVSPRDLFPGLDSMSQRALLALAAWQALLASGSRSDKAPSEAYEAADAMLTEMARQEGWNVPKGWRP